MERNRPGDIIRSIKPPTERQSRFASSLGIPDEAISSSTREELAGRISTAINQEDRSRSKRALEGIVPGAKVKYISNWDRLEQEELEKKMNDPEERVYTVKRVHDKKVFLIDRLGLYAPWNLRLVPQEGQEQL